MKDLLSPSNGLGLVTHKKYLDSQPKTRVDDLDGISETMVNALVSNDAKKQGLGLWLVLGLK